MWSLQYEAMKQLINFGYFTFQPLQETSHLVIYTRSSHNKARAFVIFFIKTINGNFVNYDKM